jgi:hypothetical protein
MSYEGKTESRGGTCGWQIKEENMLVARRTTAIKQADQARIETLFNEVAAQREALSLPPLAPLAPPMQIVAKGIKFPFLRTLGRRELNRDFTPAGYDRREIEALETLHLEQAAQLSARGPR